MGWGGVVRVRVGWGGVMVKMGEVRIRVGLGL